MTTPRLLALCSPVMRSGKSEAAGRLVTEHGFVLVKFATPLKEAIGSILLAAGYSPEELPLYLEGPYKEERLPMIGCSTRHLLQTLGTEWGRQTINQNLWVHIASSRIVRLMDEGKSVVVDDLRYMNECARIMALSGEVYRVSRPNQPAYTEHSSEGELNGVDFPTLLNDGDLTELHRKVDQIAQQGRR